MSVPPADPQLYFEQLRNEGLCADDARRRVRFRFRQHRADLIDYDDPVHLRAQHRRLEAEREEVERSLEEAEALIEALENEIAMLTRVAAQRGLTIDDSLGSTPTRERLLVRARTLLRRASHPDARSREDVVRATREFQAVEALFDSLLEPA